MLNTPYEFDLLRAPLTLLVAECSALPNTVLDEDAHYFEERHVSIVSADHIIPMTVTYPSARDAVPCEQWRLPVNSTVVEFPHDGPHLRAVGHVQQISINCHHPECVQTGRYLKTHTRTSVSLFVFVFVFVFGCVCVCVFFLAPFDYIVEVCVRSPCNTGGIMGSVAKGNL